MTKALEMINICIYIVWEKGQWETGRFKMFQGRRDTLFFCKRDILSPGNDFFLWESDHSSSGNRTTHPLGIGPLILWESDHLFSGIRGILWETGHGKQDMGNGTRYSLGFGPLILWESWIWESVFNPPLYRMQENSIFNVWYVYCVYKCALGCPKKKKNLW